ncbi:hypothetical protein PROFUN_10561 [Planoprotostelium fungivorum]|uniref:Uncharacterized protein n=1 Tax=Planoprotostelium fungivorum TaxID=1890364 RepID=A0A2P6N6T3_9EUKA|nr:hypothetical protein PROFUN_10561 [Planoprotostelium fungivorum]
MDLLLIKAFLEQLDNHCSHENGHPPEDEIISGESYWCLITGHAKTTRCGAKHIKKCGGKTPQEVEEVGLDKHYVNNNNERLKKAGIRIEGYSLKDNETKLFLYLRDGAVTDGQQEKKRKKREESPTPSRPQTFQTPPRSLPSPILGSSSHSPQRSPVILAGSCVPFDTITLNDYLKPEYDEKNRITEFSLLMREGPAPDDISHDSAIRDIKRFVWSSEDGLWSGSIPVSPLGKIPVNELPPGSYFGRLITGDTTKEYICKFIIPERFQSWSNLRGDRSKEVDGVDDAAETTHEDLDLFQDRSWHLSSPSRSPGIQNGVHSGSGYSHLITNQHGSHMRRQNQGQKMITHARSDKETDDDSDDDAENYQPRDTSILQKKPSHAIQYPTQPMAHRPFGMIEDDVSITSLRSKRSNESKDSNEKAAAGSDDEDAEERMKEVEDHPGKSKLIRDCIIELVAAKQRFGVDTDMLFQHAQRRYPWAEKKYVKMVLQTRLKKKVYKDEDYWFITL